MRERLNEEIKRRTQVVRIFPNAQSCLRLIRALAVETADNDSEFANKPMGAWTYRHGVWIEFIGPGKPIDNGYIEIVQLTAPRWVLERRTLFPA
jgi:hypothetical protein